MNVLGGRCGILGRGRALPLPPHMAPEGKGEKKGGRSVQWSGSRTRVLVAWMNPAESFPDFPYDSKDITEHLSLCRRSVAHVGTNRQFCKQSRLEPEEHRMGRVPEEEGAFRGRGGEAGRTAGTQGRIQAVGGGWGVRPEARGASHLCSGGPESGTPHVPRPGASSAEAAGQGPVPWKARPHKFSFSATTFHRGSRRGALRRNGEVGRSRFCRSTEGGPAPAGPQLRAPRAGWRAPGRTRATAVSRGGAPVCPRLFPNQLEGARPFSAGPSATTLTGRVPKPPRVHSPFDVGVCASSAGLVLEPGVMLCASSRRENKFTSSAQTRTGRTGLCQGWIQTPCVGDTEAERVCPEEPRRVSRKRQNGCRAGSLGRGGRRRWGRLGGPGPSAAQRAGAVRSRVFVGRNAAKAIFDLDGCVIGGCGSVGLKKHFPGLCVYASV